MLQSERRLQDLYADSVPFHCGRAHRGMAAACGNILDRALPDMAAKLAQLPGYKGPVSNITVSLQSDVFTGYC